MVRPSGTARNAEVVAVCKTRQRQRALWSAARFSQQKVMASAPPKLMITTSKRKLRAVTTRQHTTKVTTVDYKSVLYPMEYWQEQAGAYHERTD